MRTETACWLRPWDIGELEGVSEEQVKPELAWYRENPEVIVPGGESFANFCGTRMLAMSGC